MNLVRLLVTLCACLCFGITSAYNLSRLKQRIADYVAGKDANIGVAVIVNNNDTISVNGDLSFPMLSVYKLPIALAYIDKIRNEGTPFDHKILTKTSILNPNTNSPLMDLVPSNYLDIDYLNFPAETFLSYMLKLSDNNASDIILSKVGKASGVGTWLDNLGHDNIHVMNSEREMYDDNSLAYDNSATPIEMARFVNRFDNTTDDEYSLNIRRMLESVATGRSRLAAGLGNNAILGHKTGTGFTLPDGRIMAVNDVGYVHLDNGLKYTIAVFIENSAYSITDTEAIIAHISRLVYNHLSN